MIHLPSVTLIIVDCVDFARAKLSFEHCCKHINFGDAKILTHFDRGEYYVKKIPQINTIQDYSLFMIRELHKYFDTDYVLIAQWDGFVWNHKLWDEKFLNYDYIGAPWVEKSGIFPLQKNIPKEFCVGNGGFSIRSKRLQVFLSQDQDLVIYRNQNESNTWHPHIYPEDSIIGHINRAYLEANNFTFAPVELARKFSWENGPEIKSFGVHSRISLKQHILAEYLNSDIIEDEQNVEKTGDIIKEAFNGTKNNSLLGEKLFFLESVCKNILSKNLTGSVAELGVYKGGSARLIATAFPDKKVFLFDTFEGMYEDDLDISGGHKEGDFSDVTFLEVLEYLEDKKNCNFFRGWFPLSAYSLEDEKFCFVHLDGDYYQSTKSGIEFFWEKIVPGGAILFDDMDWIACPGVRRAVDEFFTEEVKHTREYGSNTCVIYKPIV